jgi:hypothetical protein
MSAGIRQRRRRAECTLCLGRNYDQNVPESEHPPACQCTSPRPQVFSSSAGSSSPKQPRTVRLYYRLNSPAALACLSCSLAGAAAEQTSAPLPKFANERATEIGTLSAPLPKFVIHSGTHFYELRKQRGTSGFMTLVPPFRLKFLTAFAAGGVGTNRRH